MSDPVGEGVTIHDVYGEPLPALNEQHLRMCEAAPDMLAALKETLERLEWFCAEYRTRSSGLPEPTARSAIGKARAAIAKAEGREP